jgi:DHA1 family tetracycline resistance protein-like MFS transporter
MTDAPGRQPLVFLLITILIDTIGFGIIIPVLPELIMELTGEGLGAAARYGGYLLFCYAVMQFFFAPVLGNLSDRFGRRPVLLGSLAVFGLDYLVMGLAPDLAWLFAGRLVAGVAGATHSTANAYAADVSPPEERARNFGMIGAAWGFGFILGPVIGGFLGELGPRVPFFAAAGLALLNVGYGLLVLPETLSPDKRRPFAIARANPVGAFRQMRAYPFVVGMLVALVFYQIAHDANPATWTYYTMLKFGWSERDVGYSMGAVGLSLVAVQAGLVQPLIDRFGERRTVFLGFAMMATGYAGFAFSSAGWMMIAFIVPFSLGGVTMPALRGILSNQVPENAQGELQGALASVVSLTAIGAPLFMTQLFGYFAADAAPLYFPGAPFLAAAVLVVGSVLWFARTLRVAPPRESGERGDP